jgi:hypothetical protein
MHCIPGGYNTFFYRQRWIVAAIAQICIYVPKTVFAFKAVEANNAGV